MAINLSKDTVIKITLRSAFFVIAFVVSMYGWLFMTFVTKADAGEFTAQLSAHIITADLRFVKADLESNQDKLFDLRERMNEEEGDTSDRRQKADEYERRIDDLKSAKLCLQRGESNC